MNKRPLAVTAVACIYIVSGVGGLLFHLNEFRQESPGHYDIVWISAVRLLAVVCGVYMLKGKDWARWLAMAWIASHVVLSAFHSAGEFAMHVVFCAAFGYFLFRPEATRYFRGPGHRLAT